ncbi:hypothetical protein CH330_00575 [candidate division WOR-3 bacterium JGI_Cruoil_03_51_56]|uniref:Thoeris protein ThsA Macro domain-containing protein n=1 Tax=candidate division WOR-3 bacterium JGI_Cruoil_03_51_56 TaxID=1973747 RepID=A0A235BZP3_UNCW3|nr:MAG: hypothetical protein CH330_00575 [candidate division WOR-3 bacterium JGI_Cruoil_03_51_56]
MMKDIEKITENLRRILNAPTVNMLVFFGILLIVFSFFTFDGLKNFTLTSSPRFPMFIIGCILTLGGVTIFILTREERRINKKARIEDGIPIKSGRILVKLKIGKIQEILGLDETTAVALPANTTFIDDCITDANSALGAFFLKHYPNKISKVTQDIERQLERLGHQKNENGLYSPGTTIILPPEYDIPAKAIITASTIRKEISGIRAEPSTVCECIRQIFMITADKKISKLYIPILGSGHGGLDINEALLFLVVAIKHYSKYYHHLKSIDIIVNENDVPKLKDIYRLQYLMLLEEVNK